MVGGLELEEEGLNKNPFRITRRACCWRPGGGGVAARKRSLRFAQLAGLVFTRRSGSAFSSVEATYLARGVDVRGPSGRKNDWQA